MRIGQRVYSTKERPYQPAKIVWTDIHKSVNPKGEEEIHTTYMALFEDDSNTVLRFYGFNIGKTIFPIDDSNIEGQMSLFDLGMEDSND